MAEEFWIDYSDPPFPAIRHKWHPSFDSRYHELMTLTKAREEIKERCRQERRHWLAVMKIQLSLNSTDIMNEATEDENG